MIKIEMKYFSIIFFLFLCCFLYGQCPNFLNLQDTNVTCYYGTTENPFMYNGIVDGRHTLINEQGLDPNTGNQLPLLPPGENAVIKLGNEQIGGEAESIVYKFVVSSENPILLLKFAVVLEDPRHIKLPHFAMRIFDENGNLVNECSEYMVTAGTVPGFYHYYSSSGIVMYRPWTTVGIDLTRHIGQTINVQFTTYDCGWLGHFGYAYFTAKCISNAISLIHCDGSEVTLVAPPGFENYEWSNGTFTDSSTYNLQENDNITCLLTSALGCQITLHGIFLDSIHITSMDNEFVYDTICEGNMYEGLFNIPPLKAGTYIFHRNYFDRSRCRDLEISKTLCLTIKKSYYHIYDVACQGEDYHKNGFNFYNLQFGIIIDTIITPLSNNCDSITILHLNVNHRFNMPNLILGETNVCRDEIYTYSILNSCETTNLTWIIPEGVFTYGSNNENSINLYFSESAQNPTILRAIGENGCGNGEISISINHNPTYHTFLKDTICTGNTYNKNGFILSRQDSAGWKTVINNYMTHAGCDSTIILQLLIVKSPILDILAQPSVLCAGDSVVITAISENSSYIEKNMDSVIVGDILCTDSSIVRISDWPVPNKTALGIVFFVDSTGEHGWAVNLFNQGICSSWASYPASTRDILTLNNYNSPRNAILDINGLENTFKIIGSGTAADYPAIFSIDISNGWYLPALGQLNILFNRMYIIRESINIVGGEQLYHYNPCKDIYYWSSTETSAGSAWLVHCSGTVKSRSKSFNRENRTCSYYPYEGNYDNFNTMSGMSYPIIRSIRNF